MHELYDLARALAYQVGQLQKARMCAHDQKWDGYFDQASNQWIFASNADVTTWLDNYQAAFSNFGTVLDRANAALSGGKYAAGTIEVGGAEIFAVWDVMPATDSQGNVFDALVVAFEPFEDLDRALRNPALGFPKQCLPSYPDVPPPTAPDFALDLYKLSSAALHDIKTTGDKIRDFLNSDGFMLSMTAVIMVAGAYGVSQLVTVLPKGKGR